MYKRAGRFFQTYSRRPKESTRHVGMYDILNVRPRPHDRGLIEALDNEVARRTPSLVEKKRHKRLPKYKRVYVVEFSRIRAPERFLKIGISGATIKTRFAADLWRYDVRLIAESRYYIERDARIVENNLHILFRAKRYRPRVPLSSGGNTECF